jgi:hypothetical protein
MILYALKEEFDDKIKQIIFKFEILFIDIF